MKQKTIELITFDKDHQNLQYQGECKLRLNRLSKMLCVEPKNEDYKMISALFKWNFYFDKTILFIFAEHNFQDFLLIFDEESRGKKVYDFICKDNPQNSVIGRETLFQRFLTPFCKMLLASSEGSVLYSLSKLVKIIQEWIEIHENEEKENLIKFFKDNNVFDILYSKNNNAFISMSENDNEDVEINVKERTQNRKRRLSQIGKFHHRNVYSNEEIQVLAKTKKSFKNYSITVNQPLFEFFNVERSCQLFRRLLIFVSSEKNQCYEYSYDEKRDIYYCIGCKSQKKKTTAISNKNANGLECIKIEKGTKHCCSPIKFIPENYIKMKIIKKSNYEILENCSAINGKLLIIFNENDSNQCWEFKALFSQNIFACRQCGVSAKLWHPNTDEEYVELRNANHSCQFVPFNRKKYYQFKEFILSPNFEIQNFYWAGEEKERLIIFDGNDRSFCYIYTCDNKIFYCRGCRQMRYKVPAKLLKNSDGENYVVLSKRKHICEKRQYSKFSKKEPIILRAPDFELMESTENEVNKLFIFDSKNRNLCYIFTESKNRYVCLGCNNICNNKKQKKNGKIVTAQICKNSGETFIRLNESKHLCKPKKYEPKKFEKKENSHQKCYDFFFFRRKIAQNAINVALYDPEDKRLCYEYVYQNTNLFRCNKCNKKRQYISAKIEKDENEEKEYFIIPDFRGHICKPIKVASICAPNFVILKRENLKQLNQMKKKKEEKIDENRIIKAAMFKLGPNEKDIPDTSLFIFTSEDQNYGYKYFFLNRDKKFLCCARSSQPGSRCYSSARLQHCVNGEIQIILGLAKHKCQPIKYKKPGIDDPVDDREIKTTDFITISKDDDIISNIIIFTTSSQDYCYEYCKGAKKNLFRCLGCLKANKSVTVELFKDGEKEFLKLSKQKHVCVPRKYIKEKFEKMKIIPINSFVFHKGIHGEKDKYLFIFTSEKKDFGYQYCAATKRRSYKCSSCRIAASVIENDGVKNVKLGPKEHTCKPIKYDPEKYIVFKEPPKIISNDLFQLIPNTKGEPNKALIIFVSDKKDLVYEYHFSRSGIFKCNGCNAKKFYITAKILQNQDTNNTVSLQLDRKEHICKPRKYNPNKYIPSLQPKLISNELFKIYDGQNGEKSKYLIVFASSNDKRLVYQYNIKRLGYYYCRGCEKKNHYISAKIIQNDEDGTIEGVETNGKEHICKPQKFNPMKYQI